MSLESDISYDICLFIRENMDDVRKQRVFIELQLALYATEKLRELKYATPRYSSDQKER